MNKKLLLLFGKYSGIFLLLCYLVYLPISWLVVFRDGRAVYTTLHFYPQFTPYFKAIEPHLVAYGINSIPTIVFILFAIFSFLFYVVSLKVKQSVKKVIIFALLFQCITFFSYPSLSTDIFSYIFSDRIATVYHQNVWKTKPITYKNDPFIQLSDWQNNTRVYGGVNQLIYSAPSLLGGNSLFMLVILYKLVAWIFTVLTMWIVYKIAQKHFKETQAIALQLIFWNPLFIIEILGSGHNDIVMLFFMLAGYYLYLEKKVIVSAAVLALAFQVKIIALVFFIFLLAQMILRKQYRSWISAMVIFAFSNIIAFFFMGIDPISFGKAIAFNTGVYWQGLPALLHTFSLNEKIFVLPGMAASFCLFLYLLMKKNSDEVMAYAGFIAVYLLFFASAYWNWYVLWAFCFIPFIASKRLQVVLLVMTCTSLLLYPFYWISLRFNHEQLIWPILTYVLLAGPSVISFFIPQKYLSYLLKQE